MLIERFLSIAIMIFASFFLVMSLQLESRSSVEIPPGAWPLFLTVMMLILGIVLTVRSFKKPNNKLDHSSAMKQEETAEDILVEDELVYPKNFIFLFGGLVVYVSLLGYLGFIVATLLVIFGITGLFGMKKWFNRLLTSVLSTAGFIILFPILLQLPFPRGEGIFRTISLLFY